MVVGLVTLPVSPSWCFNVLHLGIATPSFIWSHCACSIFCLPVSLQAAFKETAHSLSQQSTESAQGDSETCQVCVHKYGLVSLPLCERTYHIKLKINDKLHERVYIGIPPTSDQKLTRWAFISSSCLTHSLPAKLLSSSLYRTRSPWTRLLMGEHYLGYSRHPVVTGMVDAV